MSINSNSTRSFALTARETFKFKEKDSVVEIDLPRTVARVLVREEQDQQPTPLNREETVQLQLVQLVLLVKVH
ncbi:MAG: hypothetical protein ACJ70Z_03980 [Nitrososphaera sp.]